MGTHKKGDKVEITCKDFKKQQGVIYTVGTGNLVNNYVVRLDSGEYTSRNTTEIKPI